LRHTAPEVELVEVAERRVYAAAGGLTPLLPPEGGVPGDSKGGAAAQTCRQYHSNAWARPARADTKGS
jgi:hypothetical protein